MRLFVYEDSYAWFPAWITDAKYINQGESNQQTVSIQVAFGYVEDLESLNIEEYIVWPSIRWLSTDADSILPMIVFEAAQGQLDFDLFFILLVKLEDVILPTIQQIAMKTQTRDHGRM
eukprot:403372561